MCLTSQQTHVSCPGTPPERAEGLLSLITSLRSVTHQMVSGHLSLNSVERHLTLHQTLSMVGKS